MPAQCIKVDQQQPVVPKRWVVVVQGYDLQCVLLQAHIECICRALHGPLLFIRVDQRLQAVPTHMEGAV